MGNGKPLALRWSVCMGVIAALWYLFCVYFSWVDPCHHLLHRSVEHGEDVREYQQCFDCYKTDEQQNDRFYHTAWRTGGKSALLITCFEVITMPRRFRVCSLLISLFGSGNLQPYNIISWWCGLSFGAPTYRAGCKLMQLDTMSAFLDL